MLQNPRKTLGLKKNMVYEIPPGGGGKPYPASGLTSIQFKIILLQKLENMTNASRKKAVKCEHQQQWWVQRGIKGRLNPITAVFKYAM